MKNSVKKSQVKKAKAKQETANNESEENIPEFERIDEAIVSLNERLLEFITETLKKNSCFDFRETAVMYMDAIEILKGTKTMPFLMNPNRLFSNKLSGLDISNKYYMKKHNEGYFTDSYLALCSIYGIDPLASKSNSVFSFLDQNFDESAEAKEKFTYLNLKDIVKSKGNSIHGPRKEDIGKFNRKLFEKYSKEIENTKTESLIVNLKFFDFFHTINEKDKIQFCDFVNIYLFDGPEKRHLGEYFLVIHEHNGELLATSMNKKKIFLTHQTAEFIQTSHSKNTNLIHILHLENFCLFEFEFICAHTAKRAYELFFRKETHQKSSNFDISGL